MKKKQDYKNGLTYKYSFIFGQVIGLTLMACLTALAVALTIKLIALIKI